MRGSSISTFNMEHFSFKMIVNFLVLTSWILNGQARLLTTLYDVFVMIGDSVSLRCSSDLPAEIHWEHDDTFLYAGGIFYKNYGVKFQMNKSEISATTTTTAYTLLLRSARSEDAGIYMCREDEGRGQMSLANLTVLDSNLVCGSNMKSDGFVGPNTCHLQPEKMHFSCSVSYNGRLPPTLKWSSSSGQLYQNDSHCVYKSNQVNCSLTLIPDPIFDGSTFFCRISSLNGQLYNCSSQTVKIQYFVIKHDLEPLQQRVNDQVSCSVKSNRLLRFNWTLLQNDQHLFLSTNHTLVIRHIGLHWCKVTYDMRDATCPTLVSAAYVQNTEDETENSSTKTLIPTALFLILTSVALIVSIVSFVACMNKKETSSISKKKLENLLRLLLHRSVKDKFHFEVEREPLREKEPEDILEELKSGYKRDEELVNLIQEIKFSLSREEELDQLLLNPLEGAIAFKDNLKKKDAFETKASEKRGHPICGIAILGDELFTISEEDNNIEIYSLTDSGFSFKSTKEIRELYNPRNMTSCIIRNYLYILDWKASSPGTPTDTLRLSGLTNTESNDVNVKVLDIEKDIFYRSISVTSKTTIIVATFNGNKILEYDHDGNPFRSINIMKEEGIINIRFTVILNSGHFVISHGDSYCKDPKHRVCVVNRHGRLIKSFGDKPGKSERQLALPINMAADKDGSILVVDEINSRVLLLNRHLEFERELLSKCHGLVDPCRVCLDHKRGLLIVADKKVEEKTGGRVLSYSVR